MIELKLTISEIDYNSIVDVLAPTILEQMNSEEMPGLVKMMLLGSGMNADGIKKIMAKFPESKLESMAVKNINKNGSQTAEFIENMAKNQGVYIKIVDMEAKQK